MKGSTIVAIIGAGTVCLVLAIASIGQIIIAAREDGALAAQAMDNFKWIMITVVPPLCAVLGWDRYLNAKTSSAPSPSASPEPPAPVITIAPPVDAGRDPVAG